MIPKVIHYCWFGKNEKSELINNCIDSWHRYCPDYEISEWNEDNFNINCCDYVKEAYAEKMWAFVSDYARHFILNMYGGIYLDTDVELVKPLSSFLTNNFVALENKDSIATGLIMGCKKNNDYCKHMLESYGNNHFILSNGIMNTLTVCKRTTDYFSKRGFKYSDELQVVDGFFIYPTEYFCPINPITYERNITDKTVSIHHYSGSWCSPEQEMHLEIRANYAKKYPRWIASIISYYIMERNSNGIMKSIRAIIRKMINYCWLRIKNRRIY